MRPKQRAAWPNSFSCGANAVDHAHLLVVIDTEEEFDWSRGFSRECTSVRHLRSIRRIQDIFDSYDIIPVYAVNYPVASQPEGYVPLREILSAGRCVIAAHVHPWVTPPFEEEVCARNSYPGNLPARLESAKLAALRECIERNFGIRPVIHKAGRYGLGPNTAEILADQGFEIDVSVCPHADFTGAAGPDFTQFDAWPCWLGNQGGLLELPLTAGFTGYLRRWGKSLYPAISAESLKFLRLPGILMRLGLLNRITLSPEGNRIDELIGLVRALHADGLRVFLLALHSPSVEPGNTPYVRSQQDLDDFLSRLRAFFDFFFNEMNGRSSTPADIRNLLLDSREISSSEGA